MLQADRLARSLDVAPDTLLATLDDAAAALRYDRYYSFRVPDDRALRSVMTHTGQQRLFAFLTPDDGAALSRRGLGGNILPMTTVDDLELLLALLQHAEWGDLIVFEKPVPFAEEPDDEATDLSLITRARLLTALYQRALLSRNRDDTLLYVRCISWLDTRGAAGDVLLATTAFMLWRLVQGNAPSARELQRITGADERACEVLLARALAAVQRWYSDHADE